jgi:hypothetical protein
LNALLTCNSKRTRGFPRVGYGFARVPKRQPRPLPVVPWVKTRTGYPYPCYALVPRLHRESSRPKSILHLQYQLLIVQRGYGYGTDEYRKVGASLLGFFLVTLRQVDKDSVPQMHCVSDSDSGPRRRSTDIKQVFLEIEGRRSGIRIHGLNLRLGTFKSSVPLQLLILSQDLFFAINNYISFTYFSQAFELVLLSSGHFDNIRPPYCSIFSMSI